MESLKNTLEISKSEIHFSEKLSTIKIAEHFKQNYSNKFVKSNNQLYFFNGVYWQKESKSNSKLHLFVGKEYYESFIKLYPKFVKEVYKISDQEIRENKNHQFNEYKKVIECFTDYKFREKYIKDIINAITDDDIKFDSNPYLFCFNNKIYDLKTHTFISPNPYDYISLTTGYDYIVNLDEDKKLETELEKLISSIFPDEDEKKLYLTILATSLEGLNLQKFIIASGGGGNGKGLINELGCKTLGNYSYILPSNVLLGQQKKGSNPEIANMNNKRFVIAKEPESSEYVNVEIIKDLTGTDEVNARLNHSNNTQTFLKCTLVMECNDKPKLNNISQPDALLRRIIISHFKSTFVEQSFYDELTSEEKENIFIGNSYYKTPEFKDKYKQILFNILIKYYKKYTETKTDVNACGVLPITKSIRQRTYDYLEASDIIKEFLDETYEKTSNDKNRIKLKNVYETFKASDYFKNLENKMKKLYNYKGFISKLESNIMLKRSITLNKDKTYELRGYQFICNATNTDDDDEDDVTPKSALDF